MRPVTLITGASAGIGMELARVFAATGMNSCWWRGATDRLNALADEIAAERQVAADRARRRSGEARCGRSHRRANCSRARLEPEIVVNNAGFGLVGRAAALGPREQLGNDRSQHSRVHRTVARLRRSLARHRGGILNVASVAAYMPGPGMAVYYASKAYVLSFSEALHQELSRRGIRVTALCPGPVADRIPGARRPIRGSAGRHADAPGRASG